MENNYRVPPHDLDAEQALLGACLLNPAIVPRVAKVLHPADFYRSANSHIAEAIFELGDGTNLVSLADTLRRKGALDKAGGMEHLVQLADSVSTSAAWSHCARIVKNMSRHRQIIAQCTEAMERSFAQLDEPGEILSDLKDRLKELIAEDTAPYRRPIDLVREIYADIEERNRTGQREVGVKTGLKAIDINMNGLEPRTTIYLAARPSVGKTALAVNISEYIATHHGRVLYFTAESGDVMLMRRRLAAQSTVFYSRIRSGNIDDSQWPLLVEAVDELSKTDNFVIVDKPKYKFVEYLSALCEAETLDNPLSLVVIDHLQLMRTRQKITSRHDRFSVVSEKIQDMAKDLNVPVIVLSQLSRAVGDGPPRLEYLKESGDIEQNADTVIGLYRRDKTDNALELECLKGRDIGVWRSEVRFEQNIQRVYDVGEE